MLNELSITLNNETNTNELAIKIASKIDYGTLLYLSGDLGSGKTSFARGLIHALGFDGKVKSPSYSIVEQYSLNIHRVNHFDLYRFKAPEEWLESGFNEFIDGKDINLRDYHRCLSIILAPLLEFVNEKPIIQVRRGAHL